MQPEAQNGWYVARGGKTYGPYSWDQIAEHASGRRIGKADKILDPRTGAWSKPAQVPGLFGVGGVATAPVGLTTAAKIAIAVILILALGMAGVAVIAIPSTTPGFVKEVDLVTGVVEIVGRDDSTKSQTAVVPPEGLVYKGTFNWVSEEGEGLKDLTGSDQCYLWIYTTDDGTSASFNYGEHWIDGWPVFLVSQSGTGWVFESSEDSMVERVRIVTSVTDAGATGEITNINGVRAFIRGDFTAKRSTYEAYRADVID